MIILCTLWCIPPTLNPEEDVIRYVFLADETTRLYIYICIILQKYIIDDNSSPVTTTNKYVISFLILFFQIIITFFFFYRILFDLVQNYKRNSYIEGFWRFYCLLVITSIITCLEPRNPYRLMFCDFHWSSKTTIVRKDVNLENVIVFLKVRKFWNCIHWWLLTSIVTLKD